MLLRSLTRSVVFTLYLTLGTYAIPAIRVYIGGEELPLVAILSTILVILLLLGAGGARGKGVPDDMNLIMATALYCIASILSLGLSESPDPLLVLKCVLMASLPAVLYLCALRSTDYTKATWMLGITSLAVFVYGLFGYVTWQVGNLQEHMFGYFGVTYEESTRNGDTVYFITLFSLSFALAKKAPRRATRIAGAVVAICAIAGIVMSLSRGAWIATGVGLVISALLLRKSAGGYERWKYVKAGCFVCLLLILTLWFIPDETKDVVAKRFGTIFSMSTSEGNSNPVRVEILLAAKEAIVESSGLGVGVGNFRLITPTKIGSYQNHAENSYVQVLVEQGLLGLIGIWAMEWFLIKGLLVLVRRMPNDWVAEGLLLLIIILSLFMLFNNVLEFSWYWAVIALATAYLSACNRESHRETTSAVSQKLAAT